MKPIFCFLFLIFQFLFCTGVTAQNSKLRIEKTPSWVTTNTVDDNNKELDRQAEDGYLNLDYERQISLVNESCYSKRSKKILSDAGVQNCSEISVNFNPAFQQLIFHSICIIRDGKSIDKLRLSDFKIIQQEKELDMHLYDGSLTAYLVLDDVRKGDIIEYSFTKKGFNPICNGRYSDVFDCNFEVPVANLFYKLMVPDGRNITIKNRQTNFTPTVTKDQGQTVYEWKATNVPALHLESKTPDWYDPFGSVMISEFQSWNDVSNWAAALFPRNIPLSRGLQQKINSIKEAYPDNESRTLAALHFVQDDIRYMGIEIGINSHKPNPPDKIFAQRFGDCKDKSYLLVTMLNAHGNRSRSCSYQYG
jgi:transglutaminase-like putative cysteine protease